MKKRIFVFLFFLISACSVTESTNVKTSGIWTHYIIENASGVIRAYAVLRVGGSTGTILDLSSGEHVRVNNIRLTEWVEPVTGYHWSSALIPEASNHQYDFNFVRTDEEVHTILTLPEIPEILEPMRNTEVCFGGPLYIAWDDTAPGDDIYVRVSGDCIDWIDQGPWPDTGDITIETVFPKEGVIDGCTLTVQVLRMLDGTPNPQFQGGWIEQKAYDTVQVSFIPCEN